MALVFGFDVKEAVFPLAVAESSEISVTAGNL